MIRGCDVSHWQGTINFDLLRPASDFMISKATEGVTFTDNMMVRNINEARRVGMLVGYYHFARPTYGNSAEKEAAYFMSRVKPLIQNGELLVLDFEVAYADAVNWCKQWLDYVSQNMDGCKPLVYMDQSRLNGYDWQKVVDGGYGLWIAKYDNNPDAKPPSGKWPFAAMKQYTSSASFPGISGKVDANAFYGSHDQYKKYGYYKPIPPTPPTPPTPPDPCQAQKDEIERLKSAMSSQKIEFDKALAAKDADCLLRIASYKQKLTDGIVKYIKEYQG